MKMMKNRVMLVALMGVFALTQSCNKTYQDYDRDMKLTFDKNQWIIEPHADAFNVEVTSKNSSSTLGVIGVEEEGKEYFQNPAGIENNGEDYYDVPTIGSGSPV
jgi:hypothetical protein